MRQVRVRFPPSPTGYCHVGTARMAIVNYLFAKINDGDIIFRSEDTDKVRSKREYEDDIKESILWLGLSWDEFYRQSERTDVYKAELKKLVAGGLAYVSEEKSARDAGTIVRVIRLKNPGKIITFTDTVRGDITFDTSELKDFVIARSETDPLYHFAVVVDDAAMQISHVIRGEDHISNTPRQILIQEALQYPRPIYAHYPLHLSSDKSKLSKRKGDVAIRSYKEKGYLPEALLNYLAILGWTPPTQKEILSLSEMIEQFDLGDLHKSGAVFDIEKLRWYNREYLAKLPAARYQMETIERLRTAMPHLPWDDIRARKIIPLIQERISVWSDIEVLVKNGEFDFFFKKPELDPSKIAMKKIGAKETVRHLESVQGLLEHVDENSFTAEKIKESIWDYATKEGRGSVLWPFRYSLTGREQSPDPFFVAGVIGKDETLKRVTTSIELLR